MINVEIFLQEQLGQLPEDHPDSHAVAAMLAEAQKYNLFRCFPEQLLEPVIFSDDERRVLTADGAVIYLPTGQTIRGQQEDERPFWYVTGGYDIDGRNRLLDFPTRPIEVAIYPNPDKFFVPDSFNKTKAQQEELLVEDLHRLRRSLGLEGIRMILPEAPEVTEIAFTHFDATGKKDRLLGKNYDFRWIRTNTPTNNSGSRFAGVGCWNVVFGIFVDGFGAGHGLPGLGAVRWVVPIGSR